RVPPRRWNPDPDAGRNASMRQTAILIASLVAAAGAPAQDLPLADLQFLNRVTYGATQRDLDAYRALGREGYLGRELAYRGDDGLPAEALSFINALPVSRTRPQDL